jgi:iron(III) transport system permease protein
VELARSLQLEPELPTAWPRRLLVAAGTLLAPQVLLPGLGVLIGVVLVAAPFAATVMRSVMPNAAASTGLTFDHFTALFADPRFHRALINTLATGTGATVLSCISGLGLAWIVARTDVPCRGWFDTLNVVPFFLSPYVGAMSWICLAAPNEGLLNQIASRYFGAPDDLLNIYSLAGVTWVLALFYTPYVYLFVIGPMRRMDPALEDVARVHGAGFLQMTRYVTAPLMFPALLSGALIVFVTSAGLFDVPLALASPRGIHTVPTQVFSLVQFPSDYGRAAAIGVLVMAITIMFGTLQRRYMHRRSFATISGKGYRPRTVRLGKWCIAALGFELFYIGSGVVLPMAALLIVSLSRLWTGWPDPMGFTLANYEELLFHHDLARRALANSLIIAVVGASIGVLISLLQAYYLQRGKGRLRGLMDSVLSLPLGIPGIILGLGMLILLIRTPLYATLWIILIAYLARFFPFSMRTISAMLLSVSPDLEESARASGASWLQTVTTVLLPLIKPALLAAWLMLFVIFIRELGATILLYAQGTETISVAMVALGEQNFALVAALAVVQAMLLAASFVLSRRMHISMLGD